MQCCPFASSVAHRTIYTLRMDFVASAPNASSREILHQPCEYFKHVHFKQRAVRMIKLNAFYTYAQSNSTGAIRSGHGKRQRAGKRMEMIHLYNFLRQWRHNAMGDENRAECRMATASISQLYLLASGQHESLPSSLCLSRFYASSPACVSDGWLDA